jgi:ribokinase
MAKKIYKVAGLGQCSLDFLTSLEAYPQEDTKAEVDSITTEGGGPVATALVALARLGAKTYFSGIISDDRAGKEIRVGLKREGVDTSALKCRRGGESQRAFIIVAGRAAKRTILWQRPTVAPLSAKEVTAAFIKGMDFLLLDGLMPEASIKAATIASATGVPVMLDAGSLRPGMEELIPLCDYVVASEGFARSYGKTLPGTLKRLVAAGTSVATVTLGAKGSVTLDGRKEGRDGGRGGACDGKRPQMFKTPAFKVVAVDSTGAGDVFHGAYIFALLRGWGLERVVKFASATAALKCTSAGGRGGIPTLSAVNRFIRERG